jgi:hypothetical protein
MGLITITRSWKRVSLSILIVSFLGTSCQKDLNVKTETSDDTKSAVNSLIPATSGKLASLAATGTTSLTFTTAAPISLYKAHDITIRGEMITGGTVPCISLTNCYNIYIVNCKLVNSTSVGINLFGCSNVVIDNCYISNVSTGVYAISSQKIQVNANEMRNMKGPMPRGQFVQFNKVTGPGNRINNNHFENILGQSYPEDAINLYQSSGLSTDPISIIGNWIRGGGPSSTGGGINLGEQGGSYQTASYNTLVNPGQYGLGISGGTNIQLTNNLVYSQSLPFSNVGVVYWNQSGLSSSAITISGNKVNFLSGKLGGISNGSYIGPGNITPSGWSTNVWKSTITSSILPTTIITSQ